jgi:hypothetical protein
LIGKRIRDYNKLLSILLRRCKQRPTKNLIPKEKKQWNISWARLPKLEVSTKPIVSQFFFANPINRIISMEQIFQDINQIDAGNYLYFEVKSIVENNTKFF